jgi:hypothetical protein
MTGQCIITFCENFCEKLDIIQFVDVSSEELIEMADEELSAYLTAMTGDPLLPRQL